MEPVTFDNRQTARRSGLLAHVTSLPGRHGIGDLGPEAHDFVARISAAGQSYWQVLPVGPTGYGNSPYSSLSAFAGNPLLVSPDLLVESGLLEADELDPSNGEDGTRVDYGSVLTTKTALLSRVADWFEHRADRNLREQFRQFSDQEGPLWLDDFCLYAALKDAHGLRAWIDWDHDLKRRQPSALDLASHRLADEIETHRIVQFLFFQQWQTLHRVATAHGVALVGDLPLYVAHDSADVWANPDLFHLDQDGNPTVVAGVPPDYFSETGQRWGNPIFNWEKMESQDFDWWRSRVRHALTLFDALRFDHFRGIAGYWEIPAGEPTAVNGQWRPGPAEKLLGAIRDDLGELPIVAEDLGVITEDVIALRDGFGLPGMRVAQFGFDDAPDTTLHHPDSYPEGVWAYTGTHDNNTTMGWFWGGNPRQRTWRLSRPRRALYRRVHRDMPWGLVELVSRSTAMTSIFPVQDILGLGTEARMNTPGTTTGNWEWRLGPGQLGDEVLSRLGELTDETGRRTAGDPRVFSWSA